MADEVTQTEVPPGEEIQEGSPQDPEESGQVTEASGSQEDSRMARLEQRVRDLQSKADRAEAELKKRERSDMDEVERLKAEVADAQAEKAQAETVANHWYFEKMKADLAAEFSLAPKLAKFLTGFDEVELRQSAKELSEIVSEVGERKAVHQAEEDEKRRKEEAPIVPGGSGISPDMSKEEEKLRSEYMKTGDMKPWLRFKREHKT